MKKGDFLYSKTSKGAMTKGVCYKILDIIVDDGDEVLIILNDKNQIYKFTIEPDEFGNSYKNYYYTPEESRSKKLKTILK